MTLTLAFLFAWFVAAYLFSAFTFTLFWYEAANSPYREYLARLAGGDVRRLLLKGIFWGVFSQTAALLFSPCVFLDRMWNPRPDPKSTHPTVILLHGLYHNRSAWVVFRNRLRRAGITNIHAWNFPLWKRPFDEVVEEFGKWTKEVLEPLPGRPVVIVGHSLGGLIARAYALTPEAAASGLAAVVTLGAPHRGTKFAPLGPGRFCSVEIAYRGPAIERIEQIERGREGHDDGIARLAVYSPIDNMILPPEALKAPLAYWTHKETSPISHVAMLYHLPTIDIVTDHVLRCRRPPEFTCQ